MKNYKLVEKKYYNSHGQTETMSHKVPKVNLCLESHNTSIIHDYHPHNSACHPFKAFHSINVLSSCLYLSVFILLILLSIRLF